MALGQLFHRIGCWEAGKPKRAEPRICIDDVGDFRLRDHRLSMVWHPSSCIVTALVTMAASLDTSCFSPQTWL
jgi:hypothetical protein